MNISTNIAVDELPEIGTPEAAVRSCISLISGMSGQPERVMAYWLDLYFQVRLRFETERGARPDEQVTEDPTPAAAASPEARNKEEDAGAEQSAPPPESQKVS